MPTTTKLSPEQIPLFVANYIKDFNGSRVCREMGYSEKRARITASEILDDPAVQAALKDALKERVVRTKLEADDVLLDIQEIKVRCMQGEAVLDNDGNPTGEWKFDSRGALKACELYGRHLGMFNDKVKVELSEPLIVEFPTSGKTVVVTTEKDKHNIEELRGTGL